MKAVDLSARVRGPVVVGLCAYGFASLVVRLIEAIVLRRAVGAAWPVWDVLLFLIAVAAAVVAFGYQQNARRSD